MKLLNFLNNMKTKIDARKSDNISDFFLKASAEEKKKVFMEAARRSNEDQRETLRRANLGLKS